MIPRRAFNFILRLAVKPRLARAKDPLRIRADFLRAARLLFRLPRDCFVSSEPLQPSDAGAPPLRALWAASPGAERRHLVLYLHGGAYLAGAPETHAHLAARLARAAGCRVVLPDYRLAPEAPFPAALEDARAAYDAILARGYAPGEIAFAGDSAGGGLALALSHALQSEGADGPSSITVFSPWVDLTGAADSLRRNARRDALLPVSRFHDAASMYLNGHDPRDPSASPVFARWDSPPPVLIVASRDEILTDDATALAAALRAAGGDVQIDLWPRMPHAFVVFAGLLRGADAAIANAGAFMARHFRTD